MDRPIDPGEVRRRRYTTWIVALGGGALLVLLLTLLAGWIRPGVRRGDIVIGRVERGPVEAVLSATGIVTPEFEQVLISPVETRVARILHRPGDSVATGEPIVELDRSTPEAELRKLDDQLALKRNAFDRARLELESTLSDLRARRKVKELELKSLGFEIERNRLLLERGIVSRDAARATETNGEKTSIEIAQLSEAMERAERDLAVQLKGLTLELSILSRDREESARRLERAGAAAGRAGVVTWVVPVEGGGVRQGEEIARIADLRSYRVVATLSDVHAGRLARGQTVRVRIGERELAGHVAGVRPAVDNGVITADVALETPDAPGLRPNLRVDVHVVTARKDAALRVRRGAWVQVDGRPALFVIHGARARRTPVEFGLLGSDSLEIVQGLSAGDNVILSDMSNYSQTREVVIR